jgi:hypothetical protein
MVKAESLKNLKEFSSTRQPTKRTPRGLSPKTYLKALMDSKIEFHNPITGKREVGPGAMAIAIALFKKALEDQDLGSIKEILERIDGKVEQKNINEVSGEIKLMGKVTIDGKNLEVNIGG